MRAIKEGDIVDVVYNHMASEFGVKVISLPAATGDMWYIKRTYLNAKDERTEQIIAINPMCADLKGIYLIEAKKVEREKLPF